MTILGAAKSAYRLDHLVGWVDETITSGKSFLVIVTVEHVAVTGSSGQLRASLALKDAVTAAVTDDTVLVVAYATGRVLQLQLHTPRCAQQTQLLVHHAVMQ